MDQRKKCSRIIQRNRQSAKKNCFYTQGNHISPTAGYIFIHGCGFPEHVYYSRRGPITFCSHTSVCGKKADLDLSRAYTRKYVCVTIDRIFRDRRAGGREIIIIYSHKVSTLYRQEQVSLPSGGGMAYSFPSSGADVGRMGISMNESYGCVYICIYKYGLWVGRMRSDTRRRLSDRDVSHV